MPKKFATVTPSQTRNVLDRMENVNGSLNAGEDGDQHQDGEEDGVELSAAAGGQQQCCEMWPPPLWWRRRRSKVEVRRRKLKRQDEVEVEEEARGEFRAIVRIRGENAHIFSTIKKCHLFHYVLHSLLYYHTNSSMEDETAFEKLLE